jgi:lysylphosphatidylglycerol synthase-like protein
MGTAAIGWLVVGVLAHLANQLARGQGWYSVIRAACPDEPVRRRDALGAWVAGAGAGGVLSARGGDAVRLLLLRPRTGDAGYPLLCGTLVAEAAGEAAIGLALIAVAVAVGAWPGIGIPAPWLALAVIPVLLVASRVGAVRRLAAGVARGTCALRSPGRYACTVLPWQAASRLARALSIACFLTAFGLPATIPAVMLVMLAQGGGRAIPFAPASLGAGAAILAAAFEPVTGTAVDTATVAAFFVGTSVVLTAVGVALAVGIAARAVPGYRWGRQPLASWKRWLETRSPSRQTL